MNNIEALKKAQKELDSYTRLLADGNACWYVGSEQGDSLEKEIDYCKCIIQALKKRVPKKPILAKEWFECALCGHRVPEPRNIFNEKVADITWCTNCGNAVDWNEVE